MRLLILYAIGIYATFICMGLYLTSAHGEPINHEPRLPGIRNTDLPRTYEPAKECREYLSQCEQSCLHRQGMFRFLCIGQDYNPGAGRYRCQCGDEAMFKGIAQQVEKEK